MVCATARSGSNLLSDGLNGTRLAGRVRQYFLPKFEQRYAEEFGLPCSDFRQWVRGLFRKTSGPNRVFGFKVMAWYLPDFLGRVREAFGPSSAGDLAALEAAFPRLRCIHIPRRNRLRQAISKARALQSGVWKIREGEQARGKAVYDRALIAQCLHETERDDQRWEEFFAANDITPLTIWYEDLCANYDATVRSTLEWLGITLSTSQKLQPVTIRQADALSLEWEEKFLKETDATSSHV